MKRFGLLFILVILIHFSTQIPKYENCPHHIMISDQCECCKVSCLSEATELRLTACALFQCAPGTQIGYDNGDNTKEYPDCCEHPICKEQ
ncbi:hypothetical protein P5V15_007248 [Pogonomyrmex californicus]